VLDEQVFENKMLKAYIRDWPEPDALAAWFAGLLHPATAALNRHPNHGARRSKGTIGGDGVGQVVKLAVHCDKRTLLSVTHSTFDVLHVARVPNCRRMACVSRFRRD
jgi:hypothetical protein